MMRRIVLVILMMIVHQKILPLFINLRELNQTSKQMLILEISLEYQINSITP